MPREKSTFRFSRINHDGRSYVAMSDAEAHDIRKAISELHGELRHVVVVNREFGRYELWLEKKCPI